MNSPQSIKSITSLSPIQSPSMLTPKGKLSPSASITPHTSNNSILSNIVTPPRVPPFREQTPSPGTSSWLSQLPFAFSPPATPSHLTNQSPKMMLAKLRENAKWPFMNHDKWDALSHGEDAQTKDGLISGGTRRHTSFADELEIIREVAGVHERRLHEAANILVEEFLPLCTLWICKYGSDLCCIVIQKAFKLSNRTRLLISLLSLLCLLVLCFSIVSTSNANWLPTIMAWFNLISLLPWILYKPKLLVHNSYRRLAIIRFLINTFCCTIPLLLYASLYMWINPIPIIILLLSFVMWGLLDHTLAPRLSLYKKTTARIRSFTTPSSDKWLQGSPKENLSPPISMRSSYDESGSPLSAVKIGNVDGSGQWDHAPKCSSPLMSNTKSRPAPPKLVYIWWTLHSIYVNYGTYLFRYMSWIYFIFSFMFLHTHWFIFPKSKIFRSVVETKDLINTRWNIKSFMYEDFSVWRCIQFDSTIMELNSSSPQWTSLQIKVTCNYVNVMVPSGCDIIHLCKLGSCPKMESSACVASPSFPTWLSWFIYSPAAIALSIVITIDFLSRRPLYQKWGNNNTSSGRRSLDLTMDSTSPQQSPTEV